MKKNILFFIIFTITLFFATGCSKYAYEIKIDEKDNITVSEFFGIDYDLFSEMKYDFEKSYEEELANFKERFEKDKITTIQHEDDIYKGLKKADEIIALEKLNNRILPIGFTTEERAPVTVTKNGIKIKYKISLKYDSYKIRDTNNFLIAKYMINDTDIKRYKIRSGIPNTENLIQEANIDEAEIPQENIEKSQEEIELEEEIKQKLIPTMELKVKIPIKATSHNATKVLNDYEYVWNLDSREPISIELEYEKLNIPSIATIGLITFFAFILMICMLKTTKNNEE